MGLTYLLYWGANHGLIIAFSDEADDMKQIKFYHILYLLMFVGVSQFSVAQSGNDLRFNQENFELGGKIELYPNPTIDFINIVVRDASLNKSQIVIHNIIGNELNIKKERIADNHYRLEVKDLPSGYYFLSLKVPSVGLNRTYKFLKR